MRLAALVAALVVATLVAVGVAGSRSEARLAGTNGVDAGSIAIVLPDGRRHCERHQLVPRDADRLRMTIASYRRPMPPLQLTITGSNGRSVVDRTIPKPGPQGVVTLPLGQSTHSPLRDTTVCIRPMGRKVALGGFQKNARLEWLRPGSETEFGLIGTILHRYGVGKAGWLGSWALVLAALLVAGVWALTLRLVLREATR